MKLDEVHLQILAERLIEQSELALVKPDQFRDQYVVNDDAWKEIKKRATEIINGRA